MADRFERISSFASLSGIAPKELLANLCAPQAHYRHNAEDQAFGRIIRGYENVSDQRWVRVFVVSFKLILMSFVYKFLARNPSFW